MSQVNYFVPTDPATPVFYLDAVYTFGSTPVDGVPQSFHLFATFETPAQGREFVARLPKSIKAKAPSLSSWDRETGETLLLGFVTIDAWLTSNGVNKGRNETGIRRYHAAVKALTKLGATIVYRNKVYTNSYPTREQFEAAIS
jgi:hypothetical protein